MTTILITLKPDAIKQSSIERIRAAAPDARLVITDEPEEIEQIAGEVEIALGHFSSRCIPHAPKLRWYQQAGAGVDWLLRHPEIAAQDFILTNASGVHAIPISEHILAYLLAFARGFPAAIRAQDRHDWIETPPIFELAGKTMLLVGVGAIGRRTALLASTLGMRVIGVRSNPSKSEPGVERMVGDRELETVLPEADFIVLTIPLTSETRGLINAPCFARMKPTAYLINIGRGGTVDEPALIQALQSGQIAGAGLDVFAEEPLLPDSPLWEMKNVIVTSHYSGLTPYYNERVFELFIDNLQRYMNHQPLRNVVDKKRGY